MALEWRGRNGMESAQEVEWISSCEGLAGWVKEEGRAGGSTRALTIHILNVSPCVSDCTAADGGMP